MPTPELHTTGDKTWTSRDDALRILDRASYMTKSQIAQSMNLSYDRVSYIIERGHPTPRKAKGSKPALSAEKTREIINYITSCPEHRQLTNKQVIQNLNLNVHHATLSRALARHGYRRSLV